MEHSGKHGFPHVFTVVCIRDHYKRVGNYKKGTMGNDGGTGYTLPGEVGKSGGGSGRYITI